MVEILLGGAVGAFIIYRAARRILYVPARLRHSQRVAKFEQALREAREDAGGPFPYRAATDADAELVALLHVTEPDERAFAACGFTKLGELVLEPAGRPPRLVARTMVDEARTTVAVVTVSREQPTKPFVRITSYRDGEVYSTSRTPHGQLAEPQAVHRQRLGANLSIADLVASHRTFAGDRSFTRVASVDDHLAQLAKAHAMIVRWRDAQPPDDLLDADLRAVLGEELYRKVGKVWARRLRGKLPQATLRRAS